MRSDLMRQLDEAAALVRSRCGLAPRVGVVLGSGLGAFADALQGAVAVPYGEIPHFPVSTAIGHAGKLVLGTSRDGVPLAVMAGRVHHYEGYPLQQVAFPVRVLGRLGVRAVVLTNAAGAVNTAYRPGDIMVMTDHLNLMGGNPMIGPNEDALGERFFDMSTAYDRALCDAAEAACRAAGISVHRGVYAALTGPSYETPAEIRMLRTMGADAVGMSTVPEVIAARHMGLRVAGLSCMTNMAAGVLDAPLDHQEVLEVGERVREKLIEALNRLVRDADPGAGA